MELNKLALLQFVRGKIQERLEVAQREMLAAQNSANQESKSSMGDKYETGRAMAQIDRDMYARQYDGLLQEVQLLDRIEAAEGTQALTGFVKVGSLIQTTLGWVFVSVSIGSVEFQDTTVLVVSVKAPIGKALLGRQAGESFVFQGRLYDITQVL